MKTKMWLALVALYIAWGSTYLAIRYAVESIPPFLMSGMRFLVAGLVLYTWRRLAGDPAPSREQWKNAAIIGSLLLVGGIGGVSLAEQYVPSGITALIVAAIPLWVVLTEAIIQRRRPTLRVLISILAGLAGIFVLINPLNVKGQEYNLAGVAMILLAALFWSVGSVYSHGVELPKSTLLSTGMQLLAGSLGSIMIGLARGEASQLEWTQISASSLAGLAYLIVVGSLVGFVSYTWLLNVAPTSVVVTYAYVNPLVAVFLGSMIGGEVLNSRTIMAIPLILSAVVLIYSRREGVKQERQPVRVIAESAGDD